MRMMTNDQIRKAKVHFSQQRCMAAKRGIEWKLTYEQWINWWLNTGHYNERGRGRGKYVMCRYNDIGPYELGNIYCDKHGNNISAAHVGNTYNNGRKHSAEHCAEVSKRITGSGNPAARTVKIHGVVYNCIKDAADAIGIGYSLCKARLHRKKPGYEYI